MKKCQLNQMTMLSITGIYLIWAHYCHIIHTYKSSAPNHNMITMFYINLFASYYFQTLPDGVLDSYAILIEALTSSHNDKEARNTNHLQVQNIRILYWSHQSSHYSVSCYFLPNI